MTRTCSACGVSKPSTEFTPKQGRCRPCKSANDARLTRDLRVSIIAELGGMCVWPDCGITDVRLLVLDHKHGGGTKERRRLGTGHTYYLAMRDHLHDFQVLCCNHNHLKRLQEDDPTRRGTNPK